MAYNVSIQEQADYLQVNVSGQPRNGHEARDAQDVMFQVADLCRTRECVRILAILDLKGRLPVMAAYEIATKMEMAHWEARFRVAIVQLDPDRFRDSHFAETVAVNRGFQVK